MRIAQILMLSLCAAHKHDVKFKHSGLKLGYLHNTYKTMFWRAGLQFGFTGGLNMTEELCINIQVPLSKIAALLNEACQVSISDLQVDLSA